MALSFLKTVKQKAWLKDLPQFKFGFLNSSFPLTHFQVQKLVASPKTSPAQSSSGIGTASPRALSPNVDREGDFDTLEADRNSTKSPTSTLDSRFAIHSAVFIATFLGGTKLYRKKCWIRSKIINSLMAWLA